MPEIDRSRFQAWRAAPKAPPASRTEGGSGRGGPPPLALAWPPTGPLLDLYRTCAPVAYYHMTLIHLRAQQVDEDPGRRGQLVPLPPDHAQLAGRVAVADADAPALLPGRHPRQHGDAHAG